MAENYLGRQGVRGMLMTPLGRKKTGVAQRHLQALYRGFTI